MDGNRTIAAKIADIFDLPPDLLTDSFRLTLMGPGRLFLENHKGIILYEKEIIRVKTRDGEIAIKGRNLQLKTVLAQELFIIGAIDAVVVETL